VPQGAAQHLPAAVFIGRGRRHVQTQPRPRHAVEQLEAVAPGGKAAGDLGRHRKTIGKNVIEPHDMPVVPLIYGKLWKQIWKNGAS